MNLDKDGLASLLERVRETKGPDKVLDLDIAAALFTDGEDASWWAARKARFLARYMLVDAAPEYTASIDASLALVERLLPGWEYVLEGGKRHRCVLLHPGNEEGEGVFVETAPTLPLAILAALLTALKEVR